ncbi:Uncharacterized protein FKW44_013122, partial [Caligus rogercresseyi]
MAPRKKTSKTIKKSSNGAFMVEIVFCRLKKGMNKAGLANTRNDGPSQSFIPPDDTMLEDESDTKKTKRRAEAKKALKSLLKSGIPGIEKCLLPQGRGRKAFMKAIFGEDGTAISTGTAAALIAATCSGGDPELGNKIDPTMMAALMISCSMISAGAGMEE